MLTGDFLRGHTDAIILSILRESDNYGYQINLEIERLSKQTFRLTEATLYTTFKRLEQNQFIISYWKEGIHIKRKYYSITEEGIGYLKNYLIEWHNANQLLTILLGENNDER